VDTREEDPAVARRRLKSELRTLRSRRHLTQSDVAHAMDWSTAKLIRIEGGARISQNDLKVLLEYYGVDDSEQLKPLFSLARLAKADEPWAELRGVLPPNVRSFLSYEASASVVRNYQALLVPGLLQTEEYARVVLSGLYEFTADEVSRIWAARRRRQQLHERDAPPQLFIILDEAVIRRPIGDTHVMQQQLLRLREYADMKHVTLQMLPFSVGAHPGLTTRFVHLQFADSNDEDVLYLEGPDHVVLDDPEQTPRFLARFSKLQSIAALPEKTDSFLERAIGAMGNDGNLRVESPHV
jgi:transcriptional regulator with XRE-family HTH domain